MTVSVRVWLVAGALVLLVAIFGWIKYSEFREEQWRSSPEFARQNLPYAAQLYSDQLVVVEQQCLEKFGDRDVKPCRAKLRNDDDFNDSTIGLDIRTLDTLWGDFRKLCGRINAPGECDNIRVREYRLARDRLDAQRNGALGESSPEQ